MSEVILIFNTVVLIICAITAGFYNFATELTRRFWWLPFAVSSTALLITSIYRTISVINQLQC